MKQKPVHAFLAAGRWSTLSLYEQMGNIGSEVHRAFDGKTRGDKERWAKAFERALELMDLTIAHHGPHRSVKEIIRAREFFCQIFYDPNHAWLTPHELEKYFDEFALAARFHQVR